MHEDCKVVGMLKYFADYEEKGDKIRVCWKNNNVIKQYKKYSNVWGNYIIDKKHLYMVSFYD